MKRIGLISDPHGNLFALDAVLAELAEEEVDALICLGDVSAGTQAAETVARIRDLDCPVVQGNWDEWFCQGFPPAVDETGRKLFEIGAWWRAQLSVEDLELMECFVPTVDLDLGDGDTAFCFHGSPTSNMEGIYAVKPDDQQLARMLGEAHSRVILCGHTHVQMLRRHDHSLIVNPGSVGLPFLDWSPQTVRVAPWAEYGILSSEHGRLRVDLRRTSYDVDAFLELSLASGMPHARWWVDSWDTGATPR